MLISEQPSGTAESGLHFIEGHHYTVPAAEIFEFLRVLDGKEIRPDTLEGFSDHSGDIFRLYSPVIQQIDQDFE